MGVHIKNHQLSNDFTIVQAEMKHFDNMLAIFLEAAQWLRSIGLTQWEHFLDGYGRDDITDSINNRAAYIVQKGQTIVGTVAVQLCPDEWDAHIWKGTDLSDSILIHRLAISRTESGKELGSKIIEWIENGIDYPSNIKFIRLDCTGENKKLNDYYKSRGFTFVGSTEDGHSKYEKMITK